MRNTFFIMLAFFGFTFANGQNLNSADRDPGFNPFELPENNYFVGSEVTISKVQPDGKILLVIGKNKLVRLNNNLIDTGFTIGNTAGSASFPTEDIIKGFEILTDGKILVYGSFGKYNGQTASNIVKLNANGTIDTTFITGSGFSFPTFGRSDVKDLKVLPNGKILLCGAFSAYNGNSNLWKAIVLNADGTRNGASDQFYVDRAFKLIVQADEKVIIFGPTTYSLNMPIKNFSRFTSDGDYDPTFNSGTGFAPEGFEDYKFVTQPDGKIIAGGSITSYNNIAVKNLVRLNTDGTIDTSFNIGTGLNGKVRSILLQNDGKIVVGGDFNSYNGQAVRKVIRLNIDGSLDANFLGGLASPGLLNEYSGNINSLSQFPDGKLFCVGDFRIFNGKTVNNIVKLNADGTTDNSFANKTKGFDGPVTKIDEQPDGKFIISGNFYSYNGTTLDKLARLNADGTLDSSFIPGDQIVVEPQKDILIKSQLNDKVLVSSSHASLNGYPCNNYLIRFNGDGTFDNTFFQLPILRISNRSSDVKLVLAVANDNKIYYSGWAGVDWVGRFSRLNPDGSIDNTFAPEANAFRPISLEMQTDGKLMATQQPYPVPGFSGEITTLRFLDNGALDLTFHHQNFALSILPLPDGKVISSGYSQILTRLNPDGSSDPTFNMPFPTDIIFYTNLADNAADGKIYIGKGLSTSQYPDKILRYNTDGSPDQSFNSGTGVNGTINDLLVQSDGKLLVGGNFSTYFGLSENNIVRLKGDNFYILNGQNKIDANNNGCDVSDAPFPNLKFNAESGTNTFEFIANNTGNHTIGMKAGSYTITPKFENPNYYTASPATLTINFPSQASPVLQNFCITANGMHSDLEIILVPVGAAIPGFEATYKLIYKNKGNLMHSGTVSLNFDDAVADFISATPAVSTQTINNLVWNFSNFKPFETREIIFTLQLNTPTETPALNDGDVLRFKTEILTAGTDETPLDNYFELTQTVRNSFDPNDKTCLEGSTIAPEKIGDYVHYMIRFENKGSIAAQNIIVTDFIDPDKFDVSTLVSVSGSHLFITKIEGNKVDFIFENINLPFDNAMNDGYVMFKIKTRPTLVNGDTFTNTASIYFDYNFPIVTNTATTTIAALATTDFAFEQYFTVYPNPTVDYLTVHNKKNITVESVEIYNISGQRVLIIPNAKGLEKFDVSQLKTGSYFIKIHTEKGSSNIQFLKK